MKVIGNPLESVAPGISDVVLFCPHCNSGSIEYYGWENGGYTMEYVCHTRLKVCPNGDREIKRADVRCEAYARLHDQAQSMIEAVDDLASQNEQLQAQWSEMEVHYHSADTALRATKLTLATTATRLAKMEIERDEAWTKLLSFRQSRRATEKSLRTRAERAEAKLQEVLAATGYILAEESSDT